MTVTTTRWLLAGVAALGGCQGSQSPAAERIARAEHGRGAIVIAAPWPWRARAGVRYGDGLQMAADEANATGGIGGRPVRIRRIDDRESVDEGRLVAERLSADPDVVAVIGHLESYVTIPAAAIYDVGGLVTITATATDPTLTTHGYRRLFRTTFTDAEVGRQVADLAVSLGYHRLAIYYVRDSYGRSLSNAFEERAVDRGLTVVARQSYDPTIAPGVRPFDATLDEWKRLSLDAVFVAGEVPAAAQLIADARRVGLTVPMLGGDAMSSPELITVGGPAVEGTIVATSFHPDEPGPDVERFDTAFAKRYGVPPDAGAALGYDAANVLLRAMREAHSTAPDEVARALHAAHGWAGVTGAFTFDSAGELLSRPIPKMVVRHGQFVYLPEASPASIAVRP
jgi:branched-chain amino acid transport system substrate-binding protein